MEQSKLFDPGPPTHRPKVTRLETIIASVEQTTTYEVDLVRLIVKHPDEWAQAVAATAEGNAYGYKPDEAPSVFLHEYLANVHDGGSAIYEPGDKGEKPIVRDLYDDFDVHFTIRKTDAELLLTELSDDAVEWEPIPDVEIAPPIPIRRRRAS